MAENNRLRFDAVEKGGYINKTQKAFSLLRLHSSIRNRVLCSGMLLYLHLKNSKIFFILQSLTTSKMKRCTPSVIYFSVKISRSLLISLLISDFMQVTLILGCTLTRGHRQFIVLTHSGWSHGGYFFACLGTWSLMIFAQFFFTVRLGSCKLCCFSCLICYAII